MTKVQHILIVEDDWLTRKVLGDYLADRGYRISRAENGLKGLRALEQGDIDLVITDYAMPAMGGEALIREIRKTNPRLPVILISAFERPEVKRFDSFKDDLNDYFTKPVDLYHLQRSIQKVFAGASV
jgi:CheY-like chemotaxis protein